MEGEATGGSADRLDSSTPNVARMYHHYLGGRETFQSDRDAAEQVLAALPVTRVSAAEVREFIRRAVRFLAREAGIDQFLDLGMGLPAKHAVHEVARQVDPAARVVYVDNDPVVVSHGDALLAKPGVAVVVRADLRRPAELLALPEVRAHLDFGRPVAVLLVSVLHFIAEADDPYAIVTTIRDALAPGSYLALSHISADFVPDENVVRRAMAAYQKTNAPAWPRSRAEILRFFDGFDLVEPGLVPKPQWRPARARTRPGSRTSAGAAWPGCARRARRPGAEAGRAGGPGQPGHAGADRRDAARVPPAVARAWLAGRSPGRRRAARLSPGARRSVTARGVMPGWRGPSS